MILLVRNGNCYMVNIYDDFVTFCESLRAAPIFAQNCHKQDLWILHSYIR